MSISRIHAPLRKQTVTFIRNAIVSGKLKPNQRLTERELCDLVGVSRTTIREALRQLEAEGFISNISNKGPVVASITIEEVRDTYQLRQILEALACKVFAEKATPSQVKALEKSVEKFKRATCDGSEKDLIRAKDQFYKILLEGLGNKLISSILRNLHHRIAMLRLATLSRPGRPLESLNEINLIIDAIKRGDPDAAWSACVNHVVKAEAVALDIFSRLHDDSWIRGGKEPNSQVVS